MSIVCSARYLNFVVHISAKPEEMSTSKLVAQLHHNLLGDSCYASFINSLPCSGGTSGGLAVEEDPEKMIHFTFSASDANELLKAPETPGTKRISL